ncbi:hypothetical protein R3Q08_26815 [Rhodococcus erythropolis]|uniref:hypothetical protein n=1 Tax=Rhodococcus erythropolis TaxID=1833 RepID=UPI002948EB12|nr:hypothetical protein [Rhodococcus erythropolis]MDV6211878.1 hypothetical protein [Rhodococcus erythropolis]
MVAIVRLQFTETQKWADRLGERKQLRINIGLRPGEVEQLTGLPRICLFIAGSMSLTDTYLHSFAPERYIGVGEDLVVAVGVLKQGANVTTIDRRHMVTPVTMLESPVPWKAIVHGAVLNAAQLRTVDSSDRGRGLPSGAGRQVWNSFIDLCTARDRQRAETVRSEARPRVIRGRAGEVLAQERDATISALQIAGVEENVDALRIVSHDDEDAPFLKRVKTVHQTEDMIINADARRFMDWIETQTEHAAVAEFKGRDGRRLTVVNANRNGVESATGADLVYYNHSCGGFVLVQYKMFKRKSASGEWVCRADELFLDEAQRMMEVEKLYSATAGSDHLSYRLGSPATYFKFCRSDAAFDAETRLMNGLYVPTEYVKPLMASMPGPRGGQRLEYEKTKERALRIAAFAPLVSSGYIGSRGVATMELTNVIQARLAGDRSVVLAMPG